VCPSARPAAGTYLWGGLARVDVLAAPPATELVFYGSEVPAAGPWLRALQRVEQHALHFAHFIFISCSAACVLYKRCQLFRGSPHGQSQLSCFVAILMLETMRSCLAFCLSAGMGGAALPDRLLCQSCGRWPACCTSGCGSRRCEGGRCRGGRASGGSPGLAGLANSRPVSSSVANQRGCSERTPRSCQRRVAPSLQQAEQGLIEDAK
jgi:hypothetical protein